MSQSLDVNGIRFESCATIAHRFGYTPDYVSRLAREGKVEATRVGRLWFINPAKFETFVHKVELEKDQRKQTLRRSRKMERSATEVQSSQVVVIPRQQRVTTVSELQTFAEAVAVLTCGLFVGALMWYSAANGMTVAQLRQGGALVWDHMVGAVTPYGDKGTLSAQLGWILPYVERLKGSVSETPRFSPTTPSSSLPVAGVNRQGEVFATFPIVDYPTVPPEAEKSASLPFSDEVRIIEIRDDGVQLVYDPASGDMYEISVTPTVRPVMKNP